VALLVDPVRGRSWRLEGEVGLGRSSDNQVVLTDPGLSRRHARILARPEGWLLEDLGSADGTKVNGRRVRRRWLAPGDRLAFGPEELVFRLEPGEATPAVRRAAGPSPARLLLAGCGALGLLALAAGGGALLHFRPWESRAAKSAEAGAQETPKAPVLVPADVGAPELPPIPVERGALLARTRLDAKKGGAVSAGGLRLEIPPGALDLDRELTVHAAKVPAPGFDLALLGGRPSPAQVLAAWDVDLGPGAGQLGRPVTVSVDLAAFGLARAALVVPLVSLDGRTWTRLPSRLEGSTLRFTTRHFCPISLVGLLEAAGYAIPVAVAGYLFYDRAREFPSACSAWAPYVGFQLLTDPEGFEVSWSSKLPGVEPETGLRKHDTAALAAGIEALVKERQRIAGLPTPDVREWPEAPRRELALAVDRLLSDTLVPDVVHDVKAALSFARDYVRGRGFAMPVLDLPVYVAPSLDGDSGFLHNPWTGRRYVVLSASASRPALWTTVLHELFHHVQTGYVWVDRTGHLPLMEASALLLEREAEPHYRAAGRPFAAGEGLALAQFVAFRHGLDGPAKWEEAPVRRFGYGLSWFLESLRDLGRTPESRSAFHARFLSAFSNATFSAMRAALEWGAGGDEAMLRRAWRAFARETVLRDLEHDAGARGPYGSKYSCAPFTDSPYEPAVADSGAALKDAYGLDPTVLDFGGAPLHEIAEPALRPWSIQYYRCAPPGRPDATLVVRVPRELAPAEGPAVDVLLRASAADRDPVPVAQVDRAPAGSEAAWATLPFDGERYVYAVDTGLVGGWVSAAPSVSLMVLEPPSDVALSDEGGVTTVSWKRPPLASSPGVPLGFRVDVTDGPAWTMVLAADQSSAKIDYRGEPGRMASTVAVTTVIQVGKNEKGEPVYVASSPATASRFGLRGRQSLRLRLEEAAGVSCDDGRKPLAGFGAECSDMNVTVDTSGSFAFSCEEPWRSLKLEGNGKASGDRLRLDGRWSISRKQGDGAPESSWERLSVACTFSGEARLKFYASEGSAGIEKGLRAECRSTVDRSERSRDTFSWVLVHQSCAGDADLTGSFIPLR